MEQNIQEMIFLKTITYGNWLEKAYKISDFIRMGKQNSSAQKFVEKFDSFAILEDFKTIAKEYLYLFPRCHCAKYMLMYARMAFYAKKDS